MMMRKDLFQKVGGLNENLIFYGEEPEFGYRTAKKYHLRTLYYPKAEIIHLGGVSSRNINNLAEECKKLKRYAILQKETVGYTRAIWMSRIVVLSAYIKLFISNNKVFRDGINYEKKVIKYLQEKKSEKVDH